MKFKFGKFKGKTIEEVCSLERGYLEWYVNNTDVNDPQYGESNAKMVEECNKVLNLFDESPISKTTAKDVPLNLDNSKNHFESAQKIDSANSLRRIADTLERILDQMRINNDPLEKINLDVPNV